MKKTAQGRTYDDISLEDRTAVDGLLQSGQKDSAAWWKLDRAWLKKYQYSLRVQCVFDFVEQLTVPSGVGEGGPLKLRDFQKWFIEDIYGPTKRVDEALLRIVRRAILTMGRKNGKTALIACLVLVHLVGPEATRNGRIYSAANEIKQAALVFEYASQMVRAESALEAHIKILDATRTMVCYGNGSRYEALSAEAGTKFGYNPTMVIYDELAQSKKRDLFDALSTSMGARLEPLLIIISTQSNDPLHNLSEMIDDGLLAEDESIVCHLYAVPDDASDDLVFPPDKKTGDGTPNKRYEVGFEKCVETWRKANPALGDFRMLEEIAIAAAQAKRMPSREAAFRNLYLNQRVDSQSPFIPRIEWMACQGRATIEPGESIYLGLDLSGKVDLSALAAVSAEGDDRCQPWFWKPAETLREHETRDRVPYMAWKKQGIITTTPGRAVRFEWIAHQLKDITETFDVVGMAFDRYRIDDLIHAMRDIDIDCFVEGKDPARRRALRLVPWGQGYKDMTPAVEALEISILERNFIHDGNPCLTWNFSNAVTITDPAGNRKIDKAATRFRIDGVVATAMAIGLKGRDLNNKKKLSRYEDKDATTHTFGRI